MRNIHRKKELADHAGYHGVEATAAHFECSERTIYRALSELGAKARPDPKFNRPKRCKDLRQAANALRKATAAVTVAATYSRSLTEQDTVTATLARITLLTELFEEEIERYQAPPTPTNSSRGNTP